MKKYIIFSILFIIIFISDCCFNIERIEENMEITEIELEIENGCNYIEQEKDIDNIEDIENIDDIEDIDNIDKENINKNNKNNINIDNIIRDEIRIVKIENIIYNNLEIEERVDVYYDEKLRLFVYKDEDIDKYVPVNVWYMDEMFIDDECSDEIMLRKEEDELDDILKLRENRNKHYYYDVFEKKLYFVENSWNTFIYYMKDVNNECIMIGELIDDEVKDEYIESREYVNYIYADEIYRLNIDRLENIY